MCKTRVIFAIGTRDNVDTKSSRAISRGCVIDAVRDELRRFHSFTTKANLRNRLREVGRARKLDPAIVVTPTTTAISKREREIGAKRRIAHLGSIVNGSLSLGVYCVKEPVISTRAPLVPLRGCLSSHFNQV